MLEAHILLLISYKLDNVIDKNFTSYTVSITVLHIDF